MSKKLQFFITSLACIGAFDILLAQTRKVVTNRAQDQDLCLEVNNSGVPTEGLCVKGTTSEVSIPSRIGINGTPFPSSRLHLFEGGDVQLFMSDTTQAPDSKIWSMTLSNNSLSLRSRLDSGATKNNYVELKSDGVVSVPRVGTSSLPNIQVGPDAAVGIFSPSTNVVAIGHAGTEKMRLHSNGFVGINNQAPTAQLDVNDDFEHHTGTFPQGGNFDIPVSSANVYLFLVKLFGSGNSNTVKADLVLCNNRNAAFGGGNVCTVVSSAHGSTGTSEEISSSGYSMAMSGSSGNFRITATKVGGSGNVGVEVRQIKI